MCGLLIFPLFCFIILVFIYKDSCSARDTPIIFLTCAQTLAEAKHPVGL